MNHNDSATTSSFQSQPAAGTPEVTERFMSTAERATLEEMQRKAEAAAHDWKLTTLLTVITWCFAMFFAYLAWALLQGFGFAPFDGPLTLTMKAMAGVGCAVFAVVSTRRTLNKRLSAPAAIQLDIEGVRVVEERHRLTAARRYQRHEGGHLIYFLRTADDRVMVVHDTESWDLAKRGIDPATSSFKPRNTLLTVRAPKSRHVFSQQFEGELLQVEVINDLAATKQGGPPVDDYIDIPWDKLGNR